MVFGRDFTSKSIISRLLLMKPNRRVGENVLHADSKAKKIDYKNCLRNSRFHCELRKWPVKEIY